MLCVAVKANGYGHGAVEVARAALAGGARGLAVAFVEEGVQLREAGIDAPILLLYQPESEAMFDVVAHRLTPVLYTAEGLSAYSAAVAQRDLHPQPVHLMIDTGMHREGATPAAFLGLCRMAMSDKHVFVEGVSTHFANADDPDDPFTNVQARRFKQILESVFPSSPPPFAHCANSAAALLHPHLRFDMVRVGIALYGQAPSAKVSLLEGMQPAMSIRARIGLVRDLEPGEAIGYGQAYRVQRRSRVALISVGYGDGIPRGLSASGSVLINGRHRPIAGTISMDQVAVDCGDDFSVNAGDEAVFLGVQGNERITGLEIGEQLNTISYEVVTRVGERLPRRYLQGGFAVDIRQQGIGAESPVSV